jgi:hypothetical protein
MAELAETVAGLAAVEITVKTLHFMDQVVVEAELTKMAQTVVRETGMPGMSR